MVSAHCQPHCFIYHLIQKGTYTISNFSEKSFYLHHEYQNLVDYLFQKYIYIYIYIFMSVSWPLDGWSVSQSKCFACADPESFVRGPNLMFLAHLSRRLMGELIVYQSLRRPSVRPSVRRPSVRQHFQTSSPLKPLGQLNSNFIWRLLRTRERKFVQMVLVT